MSARPDYTRYHPRWHRTKKPIFWWVRRWADIRFITRELTSVAVACYCVVLILLYAALHRGPEAYGRLMGLLTHPASVAAHVIAFCLVLFHSITWFNLAPRALVFRIGGRKVPDALIAGGNYAAWAVVSAILVWAYVSG